MDSPNPVPPYLRVVLVSACWNSSKMRPIASSVMPMPVSVTATARRPASVRADTVIVPLCVNLAALPSRLMTICFNLS